MKHICNKLLLLLSCGYFVFSLSGIERASVAALLLSLVACCLAELRISPSPREGAAAAENPRRSFALLLLTFLLLAGKLPLLLLFLPLLLYDGLRCRSKTVLLIPAALLLAARPFSFAALPPFLLLAACAVPLALASAKLDDLTAELRLLRDNAKERQQIAEDNYRLLQSQQDALVSVATLRERNRIAREIHDSVGHLLTRSILQVGALKTLQKDASLLPSLSALQDTLNTAMTGIRQSVHDLHDESVDLRRVVEELARSTDALQVNVEYDMGDRLPRELKYGFIAIIQEALNNTLRHSDATEFRILLREHPAFWQLLLFDNGTKRREAAEPGIGLSNMADRVRALGGTLEIRQEQGFRIFISVMKKKEIIG
ncbi:MAG: histidine kinase [Lachnospiraceae bacterium]|nr:histidine kinase [Lachnospiraceae bacterium]